ncbi:hypothetical protein QOT17_023125 [Balamuthia mandrillaris]
MYCLTCSSATAIATATKIVNSITVITSTAASARKENVTEKRLRGKTEPWVRSPKLQLRHIRVKLVCLALTLISALITLEPLVVLGEEKECSSDLALLRDAQAFLKNLSDPTHVPPINPLCWSQKHAAKLNLEVTCWQPSAPLLSKRLLDIAVKTF